MDIGGQALIEGVMIRSKEKIGIAVRKPSKEIITKILHPWSFSKKVSKIPFIRGIVMLIDTILLGTRALLYSAKEQEEEGEKVSNTQIALSTIFSFILTIVLFILVPLVVSKWLTEDRIAFNILDGFLRILIFLGYLWFISLNKEIRRIFQYHGAEHMSVHCYEANEQLTIKNVRKYSPIHPRCGTSFIIIVIFISIIVFSFVWSDSLIIKLLQRILLIPIIAGLSYELLKVTAKHQKSKIMRILSSPGLWIQKITTKHPDDDQIEVAIAAVKTATN